MSRRRARPVEANGEKSFLPNSGISVCRKRGHMGITRSILKAKAKTQYSSLNNIFMIFCSRAQPLMEVTHEHYDGGIDYVGGTCVRRRSRDSAARVSQPRNLQVSGSSRAGI